MNENEELFLVREASAGGPAQLGEYLQRHRERLKRMVELRINARVRARVDASDVIQEANIEAFERVEEYLEDPSVPFYVWLRFITLQKVAQLHRRHLGTKLRDAGREISLQQSPAPAANSAVLAAQLVGQMTTASEAFARGEMKERLEVALNSMSDTDREILALRHFEQLSQKETAAVLEIGEKAAGARHIRALAKLRKLISTD